MRAPAACVPVYRLEVQHMVVARNNADHFRAWLESRISLSKGVDTWGRVSTLGIETPPRNHKSSALRSRWLLRKEASVAVAGLKKIRSIETQKAAECLLCINLRESAAYARSRHPRRRVVARSRSLTRDGQLHDFAGNPDTFDSGRCPP